MKYLNLYWKLIDLLHAPWVRRGSHDPYHAVFAEFQHLTQAVASPALLEIGSRNVTGVTRRQLFGHCREYVGFDVLAGEGVDVVGDAHNLSRHFPANYFDFVISMSVFEHLLFPWKVVLELNKIMKPGGHVYLSTHPAWPTHELPWDFWRFQVNGFSALFNRYTGFEIVTASDGLPAKAYSLVTDPPTRHLCFQDLKLGVAVIAKKIADYRADLLKWDIDTAAVIDTSYPEK